MSAYTNVCLHKCPLIQMSAYTNVCLYKCPLIQMSAYTNVCLTGVIIEHSPHHPKVKSLSPAAKASTTNVRENYEKIQLTSFSLITQSY